ncbi:MAG TPA: hypothetical protein VFS43_01135 [Polyangiaceae bacterium]|nr:hypothetical protein [Polyangiaceae bacterium]
MRCAYARPTAGTASEAAPGTPAAPFKAFWLFHGVYEESRRAMANLRARAVGARLRPSRLSRGPGTDGPAVGIVCTDRISVAGVLRLVSAAGGLDTLVPTTFELFRDDQGARPVAFSAGVEATDLGADFDLGSFVETAKYETLRLFVDGEIREGILSGSLVAQGTGSNGETAWAENIEIVTFASNGEAR